MGDRQVKSRERVAQHGEVFTAQREVNAMLDMVQDETERIESRFLEPACGEGAFLKEILRRKLIAVRQQHGKRHADFEFYSILAVSTLYGVDILADNVEICRENLYQIWNEAYTADVEKANARLKKERRPAAERNNDLCRENVRFILSKNILCGDALTMKHADGSPIIFAEWSLPRQIQRKDYAFDKLLDGHNEQLSMGTTWTYDAEIDALVPAPLHEHAPCDYTRLTETDGEV